jgi:putative tricarboxylic transport membrane protein
MEKKEWTINLAMFLVGLLFIIGSLQAGFGSFHKPGPGFLPFFVSACLCLFAGVLLLSAFLQHPKRGPRKEDPFFVASFFKVAVIVCAMVAYLFVLPWLGFFVSTFFLLVVFFKAGGFHKWSLVVISSLISVSTIYFIFCYLLGVRFPGGVWGL